MRVYSVEEYFDYAEVTDTRQKDRGVCRDGWFAGRTIGGEGMAVDEYEGRVRIVDGNRVQQQAVSRAAHWVAGAAGQPDYGLSQLP